MADAVEELLQAVGFKNELLGQRSASMQGIVKDQQQAATEALVASQTAGEKSIAVKQAEDLTTMKAQQDTLKAATNLGTNPDAASEIMTSLAGEWKASTLDAVQKREKLQKAMDTKFLDDPIGYVKAQVQMEDLAKEADAASARRLDVQNALQFAQQQTQQAAVTNAALAQTKTTATIQTSVEAATARLQAELATQRVNNSSINIAGIDALNRMDMAQINNLGTAVSVKNQVEQLMISKANLANSTAALKLQMEERADKMANKAADKAELESLADLVRKGAAAAGFQNVAAFPTAKIMQLLNLKDAKVTDFLSAGMQTQIAGVPVVSENAGTTARILSQHGAPLRPEQAGLKTFFTDVWTQAASPEGGMLGKYDNTKVDQVTKAANAVAISTAKNHMSDIKQGDNTNIYAPPTLQAIFSVPALKNSSYYQKLFAPQMAAGGLKEFNTEQLVSMTVKGIKEGAVSYNEGAEGLQAIFNTAGAVNNVTKNYVGLGLPPQIGFHTKLPNGLGFMRKYDFSTQKDVNQILNSRLSTFNEAAKPVLDSRPFMFN